MDTETTTSELARLFDVTGRYTFATLVMADGTEIAGAVPNDTLARFEGELADMLPPAA